MAKVYREVRETSEVDKESHDSDVALTKVQSFIYALLGLLEGLLAIRVVLVLMGANSANAFANFIYEVTQPFLAPFYGLFNYTFEAGRSRVELETLFAMFIYALIGWFIVKIVGIGKSEPEA